MALVGLKPTSSACLAGHHGDCREWWAAFMGGGADAFSCQCDCHYERVGHDQLVGGPDLVAARLSAELRPAQATLIEPAIPLGAWRRQA